MCRESLTQRVNPLGPVTFLIITEQLAGELKMVSLPFCYHETAAALLPDVFAG